MAAEHDTPSADHESKREAPQAAAPAGPLGEAPLTLAAPSLAALLANPNIQRRGNAPVREAALRQLQRTQGNRATRRLVQRLNTAAAPATMAAPGANDRGARVPVALQRQDAPAAPGGAPAAPGGTAAGAHDLIVDDGAQDLEPGQMRRSAFLAQLRPAVDAAVEQALSGSMMAALARPAIDRYFATYAGQDSRSLERTIRQEVPGTAGVASASAYIPLIVERVRRELPAPDAAPAPGAAGPDAPGAGLGNRLVQAGASLAEQGAGLVSQITTALFKGREGGARVAGDLPAGPAQLGPAQALPGALRSGMEGAFGQDFSQVQIHTAAPATQLADQFNARAFTVGQSVAFGPGEYQPGTLAGDALIAHELAHVVQQGGNTAPAEPQTKGQAPADHGPLEEDADQSAVGAILKTWGGALGGLKAVGAQALPRLRSGLRLSRCARNDRPSPTGLQYDEGKTPFGSASPTIAGATEDRSAKREEILGDLATMNAGGSFVFFGHSASDRKSGQVVGIKGSDDKLVTGDDLTKQLSKDSNPPTMVVLGACGSAGLLGAVGKGGVPVAVGLSDNTANVVVTAAIQAFMDAVNGGKTFAQAKEAADAFLAKGIGFDTPGELVIQFADGYNATMTLSAAQTKHKEAVAAAGP